MVLEKEMLHAGESLILQASISARLTDGFIVALNWKPANYSFAEVLHLFGSLPLPPYLHRAVEEEDKVRYQTVYAVEEGSVAAPTAGLHFTETIFARLQQRNIAKEFVTLHVGAGTFKPVKSTNLEEHEMHSEFIDVSDATIEALLRHCDTKIVAVGTTSLRTIESLYWMGVKANLQPAATLEQISVSQWDPYEVAEQNLAATFALQSLLDWMKAK